MSNGIVQHLLHSFQFYYRAAEQSEKRTIFVFLFLFFVFYIPKFLSFNCSFGWNSFYVAALRRNVERIEWIVNRIQNKRAAVKVEIKSSANRFQHIKLCELKFNLKNEWFTAESESDRKLNSKHARININSVS